MKQDQIESAFDHIIDRCRLSWSENEIIALIENVKIMRRQEKSGMVSLPVSAPKMVIGERERWS